MDNFLQSTVIDNQVLNDKFRLIKFKLDGKLWSFKPGQFVIFKIAPKIFRDYSIYSLPEELPFWEILLDVTPNGPGCKYLSKLKNGDKIETSVPMGSFFVNNRKPGNFILVATGCGFAPTKCMASQLFKDKKNNVSVLWGLRHPKDIFPNGISHAEIVLSKQDKNWSGKTGHVTDHLEAIVQKFPAKKTGVYVCGNSTLISDVSRILQSYGVPSKNIHFEQYYSGMEIA
mgnify:CR=1 FL=1